METTERRQTTIPHERRMSHIHVSHERKRGEGEKEKAILPWYCLGGPAAEEEVVATSWSGRARRNKLDSLQTLCITNSARRATVEYQYSIYGTMNTKHEYRTDTLPGLTRKIHRYTIHVLRMDTRTVGKIDRMYGYHTLCKSKARGAKGPYISYLVHLVRYK